MSELSAEDHWLIAEVEEIMAEDVHGARSLICLFSSALNLGWEDKAILYRKQLRAYVARRKMGDKVTMDEVRRAITE